MKLDAIPDRLMFRMCIVVDAGTSLLSQTKRLTSRGSVTNAATFQAASRYYSPQNHARPPTLCMMRTFAPDAGKGPRHKSLDGKHASTGRHLRGLQNVEHDLFPSSGTSAAVNEWGNDHPRSGPLSRQGREAARRNVGRL